MNTFQNKYDSLEQVIFQEELSIKNVDIHKNLDLMLIIMNTKAVLQQKISSYKNLSGATEEQLKQFELIANGKGIHWPLLDEDLSLKGFLQQEIRNIVKKNIIAAKTGDDERVYVERQYIDRAATEADFLELSQKDIHWVNPTEVIEQRIIENIEKVIPLEERREILKDPSGRKKSTSKKAASVASKVLRDGRTGKAGKAATGSGLRQGEKKKR